MPLKKIKATTKVLGKKILLALTTQRRKLSDPRNIRGKLSIYHKKKGVPLGKGMEGVVTKRDAVVFTRSGRKHHITLVEKQFHEKHYPASPGLQSTRDTTGNVVAQIVLYHAIREANKAKKLGIRIPATMREERRLPVFGAPRHSFWMTPYDLLDYEKLPHKQLNEFLDDFHRQVEILRTKMGVNCSGIPGENFQPMLDKKTGKVVAILIDFGHMSSPFHL